ncbi:MAG: Hint domain-containing protein [Acidocella sp.]|nr:Hint domain-containing protein [Acidocella sp.]
MSDTWKGSSTSWFTGSNWSGSVPTNSSIGTQAVIISGTTTNQPVISPTATRASTIWVNQTISVGSTVAATVLLETQIGGQLITLTNGANLTIQGIAMGIFYGNTDKLTATNATMTGLHGALSSTPSYDSHMQLIALGTDTLTVDTVNENFGLITIGSGDKLTISNITTGGNQQAPHGLINYGLITIASGGELDITSTNGSSGTVANFYNAGWIVDNGGTLKIASSVLDGANTASSATSIDGYIVLEGGANAVLASTVTSHEEVLFADTSSNTLQVAAGTLFAGTVAGFGATDTIIVNGFTGTSNATLVSSGTTTNLVTSNGTVQTTITLAGTLSGGLATGTNSSTGQEFILLGGSTLTSSTIASGTTFGSGTVSLGGTSVPAITLSGTTGVTGSGTDVQVNSSLTGNGTFFIDNSATLALGNTAGTDAGITVLFGTQGSASTPNTLILNDNASGFGGKINNFGVNDEIVIGSNVLAQPTAGTGLVLSYSSATGVLTVTDTLSSTGSAVSSTQLTIAGTAAGALSTASFVALEGSSGIDIELAPTTATSFTFSSTGTGSFEKASNFTGGTAPGDIITSLETVSIAVGTASISSGGVSENGIITVASGASLYDAGSLTGTGKLAVGAGGAATLLGTTTLASISDAGTLVLGGDLGATGVTLASATSNITIASNFTDNGLINGTSGTVTVAKGATAAFNGGVTAASILDYGTIDIGNTALSSINMEGASGSKVAFTGTNTLTNLTSFGGADDIVVGTAALASATSGGSVSLSYASGTLAITEGSSTAKVTVAGTTALSTSSFVALQGTDGVNIELASGLAGQTFAFTGAGGTSFEAAADYTSGIAPGDSIVAGEVVTIASGTASVTGSALVDNGTINVGTKFVDTGAITGTGTLNVGAGASATLTGNTTLGSITDAGTLVLGGSDAVAITLASGAQATIASNFSDTAAITGAGTLTVNSGVTATLASGSSVASIIDAGTLDLAGATGGVVFLNGDNADSVVDFSGTDVTGHVLNTTLSGFGTHDTIILGSSNFSLSGTTDKLTDSYNNGMLVVTDATNSESVTIDVSLAAGVSPSSIALDESTGQLVIHLCFYPGTRITTPEGEVAVEALQAGDLVVTANGAKPVRWVGQSHVHTRFADPLRSLPIRIKAGALGDGLPVRDLLLSPDHAMFIDGILVQASALVNGTSIVREYDAPEQFTYYHVELETHELLLAEGALAESFVDNVDRMHFHNWDEREAPAEAIVEMDYPRAKSARQVPMAIRQRLSGNAVNAA